MLNYFRIFVTLPSYGRHAVFAPSQYDNYASAGLPGIADLMHDYSTLSGDQLAARQEEVRRHVSLLTILTQRATDQLAALHEM
jgi:hypothetical protein